MTFIEAFRSVNHELAPLERGPNGWLCSEGEVIVLRSRTSGLPRLSLCGENLAPTSLSQEDSVFVGRFERLIDSWAGRTLFTLSDGPRTEELQLDVRPHRQKLGPGAWEALIEELCAISSTLVWGLSPGAATGRMTPDALSNVHPAILDHDLPVLLRLLRQLLADPPVRTLHSRTVRPLDISRGADLRTVRWLSRRPLELAGVRGQAIEGQPPNPRALADQAESLSSFDHPITRYIAHLLERVRRRLVLTASSLNSSAQHGVPDPSTTAYAKQLARKAQNAALAIEAVQWNPLFRSVRPEGLNDSVLQSLPDHPLYSAIHRVGWRLTLPGLAYAPSQDIWSALKHSYDLFELLVLYRLIGEIGIGLPPEWVATTESAIKRLPREDRPADGAIWAWSGPDGQELELCYQARFASAVAGSRFSELSSLSAQGVPDYILIYRRSRKVVSWIILDAKYRSGRQSIHDALGDMHRYRDALRVSGRAAKAAYIIVPQLQDNARYYGQSAYLEAHRFGAVTVYEQGWMKPIWSWLQEART